MHAIAGSTLSHLTQVKAVMQHMSHVDAVNLMTHVKQQHLSHERMTLWP